MNNFLKALIDETNFGYTENGAIKHNDTGSDLLTMFAMGALCASVRQMILS